MRNVISSKYNPKSYPGFMEGGDGQSTLSLMGGQEKCFKNRRLSTYRWGRNFHKPPIIFALQFVTEILLKGIYVDKIEIAELNFRSKKFCL